MKILDEFTPYLDNAIYKCANGDIILSSYIARLLTQWT